MMKIAEKKEKGHSRIYLERPPKAIIIYMLQVHWRYQHPGKPPAG